MGLGRSEQPGNGLRQCVSWCLEATAKQPVSLDRGEQTSKEEVCRGGKQIRQQKHKGPDAARSYGLL